MGGGNGQNLCQPRPAATSNGWVVYPVNLLLKAPFWVQKPQSGEFVVTFWLFYAIIRCIHWRLYPSAKLNMCVILYNSVFTSNLHEYV